MNTEVAASKPRARISVPSIVAWLTLPAVVLGTLFAEIALAERKYAIFGGGFGQSRALDAPVEILAFAVPLLLCQALIFYLLFRLVRRLHGRRADTPLFYFNFAFFIAALWLGALVAKYQALSYFSDAMSFQIVRNLGGGSLFDALLFSLSETGLILIALLGSAAFYFLARWFVRRRWTDVAPFPDRMCLPGRWLAPLLLATPFVLYAGQRVDDSRSALARFNAIALWTLPLHQATDLGRDGWSFFSHPIDLQPFDATRHPFALDVPGNGVDEDGYGGDLAFTPPPDPVAPVISGERPHVILIVLESTRDDAVGMRLDGRPLTPVIDALARRGSRAPAAYSHVGFTTSSLKSLFTGELDPGPGSPSLIDDFLANGYDVGVFSGQSEDFGDTAEITGMRRGRHFVDADALREERAFGFAAEGSLYIDGRIVLREFDRLLGDPEAWETPHFLYFNFQSAHFPYDAPGMDRIVEGDPIPRGEISAENRERVERTYLNAVAYDDVLVGELLDRLERLGVLDDSLIVVTADHGESLFDDGFLGHGHMLNAQQTRIPFVLSAPDVDFGGPVGLADMRRIILRAAGADILARPRTRVFQYLGTLDRPGEIATVDAAGGWTIFNLSDETVQQGDGSPAVLARLPEADPRRASAMRLIDGWARERWLGVLRRREAGRAD